MNRPSKDEDREERIIMDIVVDAYGADERSISWFYYLDDTLQFPFDGKCKSERQISPLKIGDAVVVTGMADAEECQREMFVTIYWNDTDRVLAIPLSQIDIVEAEGDETIQAVGDWHYWTEMGYEF